MVVEDLHFDEMEHNQNASRNQDQQKMEKTDDATPFCHHIGRVQQPPDIGKLEMV